MKNYADWNHVEIPQDDQSGIIAIKERKYQPLERAGRVLLGLAAVICTLFIGMYFESVRNCFLRSTECLTFCAKVEEADKTVKVVTPLLTFKSE